MSLNAIQHKPILGILGSGQLAKMLAHAASQLGVGVKILEKSRAAAPLIPWESMAGNWDDPETLVEFASGLDFVTLENEFVNPEALAALEDAGHALRPSAETMRLIQDKLHQKEALRDAGLPVPGFRDAPTPESVIVSAAQLGWPLVLKKRRLGYDGKGNATIRSAKDVADAWQKLGGDENPLFAEQFCAFQSELATIVVRPPPETPGSSAKPRAVAYPVVETIQRDHICHIVKAPAPVAEEISGRASDAARRAVEAVHGTGAFGVEMFLLPDGRVVINELAPRVHNSGHYTIEACACSQFENHVRAVLGWPLGSAAMRAPAAVMVNLLAASDGPGWPAGVDEALGVEGAHVHVYGKDRSVKGRKMGHVTALGSTIDDALERARRAASLIRFGGP